MFTNAAYAWPLQNYKSNPGQKGVVLPTNVASAAWQKRQIVQSVLAGRLTEAALHGDGEEVECNTCDVLFDDETGDLIYLNNSDIIDGELVLVEEIITSVEPVSPTAIVEVSRAGARVHHGGPLETAPPVLAFRGRYAGSRDNAGA
jgi:hypothetical protein